MRKRSHEGRICHWVIRVLVCGSVAACDGDGTTDPEEVLGSILVTVSTATDSLTGSSADPDGYLVLLDGDPRAAVGTSGTVMLNNVPIGYHTVAIDGVAENCQSARGESFQVDFRKGMTPDVSFEIDCWAPGKIAFMSDREGSWQVYLTDVRESEVSLVDIPIPLGGPGWFQEGPKLSRDGTRIALLEKHDIWVVGIDGTGPTRVVEGYANSGPAWSPDGTKIAFEYYDRILPPGEQGGIGVANADGSCYAMITDFGAELPDWSPDGTKIAFEGDPVLWPVPGAGHTHGLWVVNADGTGAFEVAHPDGKQAFSSPKWSPSGEQIVFQEDVRFQIFLVNFDGTGLRTLVGPTGEMKFNPLWSPDGSRIAFRDHWRAPGVGITSGLTLISPDGTGLLRIPMPDWGLETGVDIHGWSPDGSMLAFGKHWYYPPFRDVTYTVNADGTGLSTLIDGPPEQSYKLGSWGW